MSDLFDGINSKRLRAAMDVELDALLKSQIPIRTWAEWNEDRPGFVEMDLVGHDGGDLHGDYCLKPFASRAADSPSPC